MIRFTLQDEPAKWEERCRKRGRKWLKQHQHDCLILDPFEVKDDWFEIILPSLQLVLTNRVPRSKRKKAKFTVVRLGLQDGEVVIRCRKSWFDAYRDRKLTLEGLRDFAPLIALAVERDLANHIDWRR